MSIKMKNQDDVMRASDNFNRVANKIKEREETIALLGDREIRLAR